MDDLESAMNTLNVFERFTKDSFITLKSGVIDIQVVGDADFIQIEFGKEENYLSAIYEISFYKELSKPIFYYNQSTVGSRLTLEKFLDTVKLNNPDFFEWMIWNLP